MVFPVSSNVATNEKTSISIEEKTHFTPIGTLEAALKKLTSKSHKFDLLRFFSGWACTLIESFSHRIENWLFKEDLPNFHQVSDELYRGGQPVRDGFKTLEEKGIKTVINLRAFNTSKSRVEKTDITYIHLPFKPHMPRDEKVKEFIRVLRAEGNAPVFLHCYHGSDRTGLYVAIYKVVCLGLSKEEAKEELINGPFGFHTFWQRNLIRYFDRLEIG